MESELLNRQASRVRSLVHCIASNRMALDILTSILQDVHPVLSSLVPPPPPIRETPNGAPLEAPRPQLVFGDPRPEIRGSARKRAGR